MNHSSNSISGIKMSSNENDAMRINDILFEANNSVCYTPKTEPRVQRCGMMNMQQNLWQLRTWTKIGGGREVNRGFDRIWRARAPRFAGRSSGKPEEDEGEAGAAGSGRIRRRQRRAEAGPGGRSAAEAGDGAVFGRRGGGARRRGDARPATAAEAGDGVERGASGGGREGRAGLPRAWRADGAGAAERTRGSSWFAGAAGGRVRLRPDVSGGAERSGVRVGLRKIRGIAHTYR